MGLVLGAAGKYSQRSTVGRQFLHVKNPESVSFEDAHRGQEREIGEVFVVDGVEFVVLHEPEQMRKLQSKYSMRLQEDL